MAGKQFSNEDILIPIKVVDTNQDYPASIDYRLIVLFLVVAGFLFSY